VTEERLVARAQVVQARLAVRRGGEPVLRTSAVAGEAHVAPAAEPRVVKPLTLVAAVDAVCGQGLSPLSGIGVCGACCLGASWYWFQDCACLVNRDSVSGGQGGPGRQVVVAAQQQIHRMRALGRGRDEYPDYRPARAAAAAIGKARRPRPGSLEDGCPQVGLGFAGQEPHRLSAGAGSRESATGGQRSASRTGRRPDGCIPCGLGCRRACWTYAVMPAALG